MSLKPVLLCSGALVALLLALSPAHAVERRVWGGRGETLKASEDANWVKGRKPQKGDRVVFGATSEKDCTWDLDVLLSSFTMTHAYTGRVTLEKANLRIERNIRVAGGTLDLGDGRLTVLYRLYVDWGGRLEMGQGELNLGEKGILIDNGGTLSSTGDKTARVTSTREEHYPFVVGKGNVLFSNPAGTIVENSKGIVLYSESKVEKAESVHMRGVEEGATAVTFGSKQAEPVKFEGWTFDENAEKKIEIPGSAKGKAEVDLVEAKAPPPGVAFLQGEEVPPAGVPSGSEKGAVRSWTGNGVTGNASDPGNWQDKVPGAGEAAVFASTNPKTCVWDLDVSLVALRLDPTFTGEVRLGTAALSVESDLEVSGGKLDLETAYVKVAHDVRISSSGALELGGSTLRIGNALRMEGGRLSSSAEEAAILTALEPGGFFSISLEGGQVNLSNPDGTRLDASSGLLIGPEVDVARLDAVAVTHLKPGASALVLKRNAPAVLVLNGWSFDESVKANVDASGLPSGSRIAFAAASGARFGSPYQKDPNTVLVWEPDWSAAEKEKEEPLAEKLRHRASITPYIGLEMLGGQYFFEGTDSSLSGNARFLASAAITHPRWPAWTLQPIFTSQYRGTKQVEDLVGGGTLFQEVMDHRIALQAIYKASPKWRLKPELSYKLEYLKETRDERWGKGLFDQHRPMIGVEAEYLYRSPLSVRFGYDYYRLTFPNYISLESRAKGQQGGTLARELSGSRVIDSSNHAFSLGGTLQLPWRSYAEANASLTFRGFTDQHVVSVTGDLRPSTRNDLASGLGLDWRFPRQLTRNWKLLSGLSLGYTRSSSNQNSYDAQRVRFLPHYYDSSSWQVGGEWTAVRPLSKERALDVSIGAAFMRTDYPDRPVQDASGTYNTRSIHTNGLFLSSRVRFPVINRFYWTLSAQYGRQASNMKYEKLYRYNYSSFAYMTGFSWEY